MKRRTRIRYTDAQKALMWDRWQKGESLYQIARPSDAGRLRDSAASAHPNRSTRL